MHGRWYILPKIEAMIFFAFHGKKTKFVRSFFGRIYGAQICLWFYLTFSDWPNVRFSQTSKVRFGPLAPLLTSIPKISIPSALVIHYCAWYTYFRNGRYFREPMRIIHHHHCTTSLSSIDKNNPCRSANVRKCSLKNLEMFILVK